MTPINLNHKEAKFLDLDFDAQLSMSMYQKPHSSLILATTVTTSSIWALPNVTEELPGHASLQAYMLCASRLSPQNFHIDAKVRT